MNSISTASDSVTPMLPTRMGTGPSQGPTATVKVEADDDFDGPIPFLGFPVIGSIAVNPVFVGELFPIPVPELDD